jgi:hypothetical protein
MNQSLAQYVETALSQKLGSLETRLDALQSTLGSPPAPGKTTAKLSNKAPITSDQVSDINRQITMLHSKLDQLQRNQLPRINSELKVSQALKLDISRARAEQDSILKRFHLEQEQARQSTLDEIAGRQKKLLESIEYKNAVNHGSYSEATLAIARKKQEVQSTGLDCFQGISGYSVKGLLDQDNSTIFTFGTLDNEPVEITGTQYQIVKAEISPISAGNVYHIRRIK